MKDNNFLRNQVRHIRYGIHFLFEKMRGLDFTITDMTESHKTGGVVHGYSKTDGHHTKRIFNRMGITQNDSILDIGCGKGAFLKEACKYPFKKIAGVEYSVQLADIAKKKFSDIGTF